MHVGSNAMLSHSTLPLPKEAMIFTNSPLPQIPLSPTIQLTTFTALSVKAFVCGFLGGSKEFLNDVRMKGLVRNSVPSDSQISNI